MKVSIIIPSFNGALKLPNILGALAKQSINDIEVIVALDGSTDTSKEICEEFFENSNINGQVIWTENKGRAGIRNYGANQATGELLIFFDDDMRPHPNCVENHIKSHQFGEKVVVGTQLEEESALNTDIQRFKFYLSEKWQSHLVSGRLERPYLTAANMSIPKSLFQQMKGFNTDLTDAEDFELACRLFKSKTPIYFDSTCNAYHDDFITLKKYIKRQKEYRNANEIVFQMHPEYALVKQSIELNFMKNAVYYFLGFSFWAALCDKGFFVFLPKKLRYKMYDVILTSAILK